MNLANRLIIVLGALLLMFAVAVVILFTWAAASESVQRLSDFVQFLHDHEEDNGSRVILTLGGIVVALLALAVIIAELTPPRAERVPVRDVRAGDALLSTDAIAQRLQQEVSMVPHVSQAKATVTAHGKGVEVNLELHVDPDTNLALTSEEACRAVENLLTNRLSVEMARPPRLNLRYSELRMAGAPAGVPPSAPPPPAEEPPTAAEQIESPAAAAETPAAAEEGKAAAGDTPPEAAGEGQQAQKES
jgi:flagellar basal body-associated protein FliL